jgi:CMP-N-acetylneuraminic acid synthetase
MNIGKKTAILPVRAGSQRVKNKNFRKFFNSSLFEIKLEQLMRNNFVDEVIVSSDSEHAIEIASSKGAIVHRRDPYHASSGCSNSDFFLNFCEMTDAEYIIYSPCTAPLISDVTYRNFFNYFYRMEEKYDSLATVSMLKKHIWDETKPLNYNIDKSPNSQDLPNLYVITYGINITSRASLLKNKNIVGNNPKFFILDDIESIDVDNMDEFQMAEYFYYKKISGDLN